MQPPRLLLDEHIWIELVTRLTQHGYDVTHIVSLGKRGLDDSSILELAAREDRVVLTFNSRDFMSLALQWFEVGKDHAGIVLSPELSRGDLLRRSLEFLEATSADDMRNQVRWLSDFKTR